MMPVQGEYSVCEVGVVLFMKRVICFGLIAVILGMLIIPESLADGDSSINILLLGTDNFGFSGVQVGEAEEMSRADAIYIISIQPENKSIKLLSIERDYLAVLPDNLGENKLGIVTYFGGPEMAINVINDMFNLDIRLYAHIDINNLITAVDIFGGVDVNIYPEEVDEVNAFIADIKPAGVPSIVEGLNHLNGLQAWSFMGVRTHEIDSIESNAQRNERQQRVLAAVIEQAGDKDTSALLTIIVEVLPLITTNISTSELIELAEIILSMNIDQIEYLRTPFGSYTIKRINMHRVVVSDDMVTELKLIHNFLK